MSKTHITRAHNAVRGLCGAKLQDDVAPHVLPKGACVTETTSFLCTRCVCLQMNRSVAVYVTLVVSRHNPFRVVRVRAEEKSR